MLNNSIIPFSYVMFCIIAFLVDTPYVMVMRTTQLVDMSLNPGDKTTGFFTPVIGIENGHDFDYDKKKGIIYYIQLEEEDKENVSL